MDSVDAKRCEKIASGAHKLLYVVEIPTVGKAQRYSKHPNGATHSYHHLQLPSAFYRAMSESPDLGRGKRSITQTPGGRDFAKKVSDSDAAREKRARKKEIQRQETILAAEDSTDEDEEVVLRRKKSKSSAESSSKSKSKSKSKSTSKSSKSKSISKMLLDNIDEDHDLRSAEVARTDQSCRTFLIDQIHARDKSAISKLKTKETWELEYQWSKGKPPAPHPTKDRPLPKPVAKTPMWKLSSSIPKESSFDVLGSPVMALRAAEDQSEKVLQSTPVPASRKRDYSAVGEDINAKRSRIGPALNLDKPAIPTKPSATVRPSPSSLDIPKPNPSETRASQEIASSGRSNARDSSTTSPAPAREANDTALEEIEDNSIVMLDPSDVVDVGAGKNPKKSKKSGGEEKVSNKKLTRDYEGTENAMINQTLWIVVSRLGSEGFFPSVVEYERMIRKSWKDAARELNVSVVKYAIDDGHISCVKERVNSYRSRTVSNIVSVCDSAFPKLKELSGRKLKKYVKSLEENFYMKPGAKPRKGYYKHPVLLRSLHKMCYIGKRPAGIWYPERFRIVSLQTIASICSILQFHIHQHATGEFKAVKAEMGLVGRFYADHLEDLETFQKSVPPKCLKVQKRLHEDAMKLAGKEVPSEKKDSKRGGRLTREDFCEEESESDSSDADDQARSKAETRRSSSKTRNSRQASESDSEPGSNSDSDLDSSSNSGSDSGSGSESESESGSGSDPDSQSSGSGARPRSRSGSRPGSRPGSRSRSRPGSRPSSRSGSRSGSRSDSQSKHPSEVGEPTSELTFHLTTDPAQSASVDRPPALKEPHDSEHKLPSDPKLNTLDSERATAAVQDHTNHSVNSGEARQVTDLDSQQMPRIPTRSDNGVVGVANDSSAGNKSAVTTKHLVGGDNRASSDPTSNDRNPQSIIPTTSEHPTPDTMGQLNSASSTDHAEPPQTSEPRATRSRTALNAGDSKSGANDAKMTGVEPKKGGDKKPGRIKDKSNTGKERDGGAKAKKAKNKRAAEEDQDDAVSKSSSKRACPSK